jgi:hypothetical protein
VPFVASSVLTVIACSPILAGWAAVCVFQYLSLRRRRRQRAQWARLAATLTGLDAELDQIWAAEQERIRRHG